MTEAPARTQPKGDHSCPGAQGQPAPGWEKPQDSPAPETCRERRRGPSPQERAAVPMPDDGAGMETAKKEKVAVPPLALEASAQVPAPRGGFSSDPRLPLRS